MKKIISGLSLLSVFVLAGCSVIYGNENTNKINETNITVTSTELEPSFTYDSEKELYRAFGYYNASPLTKGLFELDNHLYDRIISSSSSKENAKQTCVRHFTDKRDAQYENIVVDCSVIYEDEMLYGINVKWDCKHGGKYEVNVISFKKDIADVTVRNVIYNDQESFNIKTKDKNQLEKIALYLYEYKYSYTGISKYDIEEDNNNFTVKTYHKEENNDTSWGNIRFVYDYKGFITININTGEVTSKLTKTAHYPDFPDYEEVYEY